MATRTLTKTRTQTKTKKKRRSWDDDSDSSENDRDRRGETSVDGHRRLSALQQASRRSFSLSAASNSFDLSNSSDEEAEDDFADDIRAEIRQDIALREEKKKNGGRLPRKKTKESKADKQTHHTRKLLAKGLLVHNRRSRLCADSVDVCLGQPREQKTAKWAIRERKVNPLVKLLSTTGVPA